jgi:acyl carrier protein
MIKAAILAGGSTLRLADLDFDSLGWMEFCISIELQTGAELTPDILSTLDTMADVAGWIAVQRTR